MLILSMVFQVTIASSLDQIVRAAIFI